jgi:hypothetical protein
MQNESYCTNDYNNKPLDQNTKYFFSFELNFSQKHQHLHDYFCFFDLNK